MIVRVMQAALAADVGPVAVAACEGEVVAAVEAAGGRAVLTDPDLPSGSDRVWAAALALDPEGVHDIIVNIQGDMPTLQPEAVRAGVEALIAADGDIATLVCPTTDAAVRADPSAVQAIVSWRDGGDAGDGGADGPGLRAGAVGQALYFTRADAPWGDGPVWRHLGVYVYRRAALARFTALAPSPLEQREKLEQLRALEAGMRITVAVSDHYALGVDTPEDLDAVRAQFAARV